MYHSENEKVRAGRSLLADHILGQRKVIRGWQRAAEGMPEGSTQRQVAEQRIWDAKRHLWALRVVGAEFCGITREVPYPVA